MEGKFDTNSWVPARYREVGYFFFTILFGIATATNVIDPSILQANEGIINGLLTALAAVVASVAFKHTNRGSDSLATEDDVNRATAAPPREDKLLGVNEIPPTQASNTYNTLSG